MTYFFCDIETTSLNHKTGSVWEIGWAFDQEDVQSAIVSHTLVGAEAAALEVGNYWHRMDVAQFSAYEGIVIEDELKRRLKTIADSDEVLILVGANPRFDADFLRERWGFEPWHYRLFDIESYAASIIGKLLDEPLRPRGLFDISRVLRDLGWTIPEPDHTAGGDVAALRACFEALQGHDA